MGFTYDDFRGTEALRTEFGRWLRSDVGMLAMRAMRDKYRPWDVPPNAEGIVSARILSQFHGAHMALDDLELLATSPMIQTAPESEFEAPLSDHDRAPSQEEIEKALNQRHHDA